MYDENRCKALAEFDDSNCSSKIYEIDDDILDPDLTILSHEYKYTIN